VRVDAQLYYANALTVRDQVKGMIAAMGTQPRAVIFDDSAQDELDLTTAQVVKGLLKELNEKGIEVLFAGVHAPMLEGARATGLIESIDEGRVFPTVEAAVRYVEAGDAIADRRPSTIAQEA
jgi:sulfate permease, SulP family